MSRTVTRLGVRYRLGYTRSNRWGVGKAHCLHWSPLNKDWFPVCRRVQPHQIIDQPVEHPDVCKGCVQRLTETGLINDIDQPRSN